LDDFLAENDCPLGGRAVGIEIKATLQARKLLSLFNAKNAKNLIRPSEVHGGYTEILARRSLVIIDGDAISPNGT